MPELSSFYGIRITLYFRDHLPPHFHAEYGDDEVLIDINTLTVYRGSLPNRALNLVLIWAKLHQHDLQNAWTLAQNQQHPGKIAPLP